MLCFLIDIYIYMYIFSRYICIFKKNLCPATYVQYFFFFQSARQQIFVGCVQLQLKTQARKCGELLYLKLAELRNCLLYIRDSSHRLHRIQIVINK
jgi:hypothetical protein